MANLTPERREQLRQQAERLNAEPHPDDPTRRKFGGPQPGSGRPRVPRATELAARAATEHSEEIIQALLAGVRDGDGADRSRGAARWLELVIREGGLQVREQAERREQDRFDLMSEAEVYDQATGLFMDLLSSGGLDRDTLLTAIAAADRPPVDAEVIED